MQIPHVASVKITRVDKDLLRLLPNNLLLASRRNSTAKFCFDDQIQRSVITLKSYPRKTLLCTEANVTSLLLSPSIVTKDFCRMEPLTNDIVHLKWAASHTLYCLYYCLHAPMFHKSGQSYCLYLPLSITSKLVIEIPQHSMSLEDTDSSQRPG